MMEELSELILFRGLREPENAGALVELAERYGFGGDLWRAYFACALLRHENPWSLACEGREEPDGSLSALAARDVERILQAYRSAPALVPELRDYRPAAKKSGAAKVVDELRASLDAEETASDAARALADAYRRHGAGQFALHRAFRASEDGSLKPVPDETEPLSLLVGCETQKAKLRANTEAFLAGRSANNVLLYGDAGTGKSTCVRALLAEYPDSLLRVIELPKDRLALLPRLADTLGARHCRFLLFLDDLSFEEDETAYKQLKAAIEGGLASLPENVRIYATSNRRHLVRETWKDRADMEHDGDIHRSDTMEEKLSLSARFGLRIYFPNPTFEEYHAIVEELAKRAGADGAALRQAASTWQVRQGSRSGRTAKQFVDDYLSRAN